MSLIPVIGRVIGDELVLQPLCEHCAKRAARVGRLCAVCDERLAVERADIEEGGE